MIVLGLFAERQVFVQRMELMIMKSFDDSTVYGGADDIVSIIHSLRVADINQISVMIKKMYMPTHCIISDLLDEDSVVLAEQITAIPKWRLRRKLCACEDAKMVADIETAVKVQLGLEDIHNEKQ